MMNRRTVMASMAAAAVLVPGATIALPSYYEHELVTDSDRVIGGIRLRLLERFHRDSSNDDGIVDVIRGDNMWDWPHRVLSADLGGETFGYEVEVRVGKRRVVFSVDGKHSAEMAYTIVTTGDGKGHALEQIGLGNGAYGHPMFVNLGFTK